MLQLLNFLVFELNQFLSLIVGFSSLRLELGLGCLMDLLSLVSLDLEESVVGELVEVGVVEERIVSDSAPYVWGRIGIEHLLAVRNICN